MVATALWVIECGCHGVLGSRVWLPWWLGGRLVVTAAVLAVWSLGAVAWSGEATGHRSSLALGARAEG